MKNFLIRPPLRKEDKHGSGAYLASRGKRKHKGIDVECPKGSGVLAVSSGKVIKIGIVYNQVKYPKKAHFRYVKIRDIEGYHVRYLYLKASVKVGDRITTDQLIGTTQGLLKVYPGIGDHFHFDVSRNGVFVNPHEYLELL